jgi:hypothetical protein
MGSLLIAQHVSVCIDMYRYVSVYIDMCRAIHLPKQTFDHVWFHAAAAQYTSTALFWVITQRTVVIPYRSFGTTCRSHFQVSRNPCKQQVLQWDNPRIHQFFHLTLARGIYWAPSAFESHFLYFSAPEDGTDRLSRNSGKELSRYAAWKPTRRQVSFWTLVFGYPCTYI